MTAKDSHARTTSKSSIECEREFSEFASFQGCAVPFGHDEAMSLLKKSAKDLVQSPLHLGLFYLFVSLIGYVVTLGICAQNAVGLTNFSLSFAMRMCAMKEPWCWLLCGAIFSGIPTALTFTVLNEFQRKFLLHRMRWLVAIVPIFTSSLIIGVPHLFRDVSSLDPSFGMMVLDDSRSLLLWLASAIFFPYILDTLIFLVIRQRKLQPVL